MSSYAWTLPSSPSTGSTGDQNPEAAFDDRVRVGRDLFFDGKLHVSAARDWVVVEGVAALRQWVWRVLSTSPGSWSVRPDYGVGVEDFVYETLTASRAAELRSRIIDQLQRHPRIQRVTATEIEQTDAGVLILRIAIEVAGTVVALKPFAFPEELP